MSVWFYVGSIVFVCVVTVHILEKEIQKNMPFQLPCHLYSNYKILAGLALSLQNHVVVIYIS